MNCRRGQCEAGLGFSDRPTDGRRRRRPTDYGLTDLVSGRSGRN